MVPNEQINYVQKTLDKILSDKNLKENFSENENNNFKKIHSDMIELKNEIDENYTNDMYELEKGINMMIEIIQTQQNNAKTERIREKTNIKSLIDDAIKILESLIINNKIIISKDYSGCPDLILPKAKLLQIFINLIKNAIESILESRKKERKIEIKAFYKNDEITLIFKDNGLGISRKNLKKIFNFGFSTKNQGHGFGLHTCQNFLNELNGTISAESEGKHKGAEFIIKLPITH
jgi:signal transduction histidine kinase